MEDMAREFGGMLKETFDKMRERIELVVDEFGGRRRRTGPSARRRVRGFSRSWSGRGDGVVRGVVVRSAVVGASA